jgi:hypothetical protein
VEWGILVIGIIFLVVGYMVLQGTRVALAWRKAAASGDVDVIRQILEDGLVAWRSMKRPKEVPVEVWRGVQTAELIDVGPDSGRVSCQAESEYRLIDGSWVEVASPLQEGFAVTARLAEMLLYDVPNLNLAAARIDVHTTFRDSEGASRRACILTTTASRQEARAVDWENWTPVEVVDALGGRYRPGEGGVALPIEIDEPEGTLDERRARAKAAPPQAEVEPS